MKESSVAKNSKDLSDGGFRTDKESLISERLVEQANSSPAGLGQTYEHFPKFLRRQRVTRFLALYEIFKLSLPVMGSIIECGVNQGFGLFSWLHFSSILEPNNLTRRIYGFDTFAGFPTVSVKDKSRAYSPKKGHLAADSYQELSTLIQVHDDNRFLGHVDKAHLIKGDIKKTAPLFLKEHQHLVVSLLFLDLDLFEPTKAALQAFVPRMPKGAIIAFDELNNPIWPGETLAMLEHFRGKPLALKRLDFDPYISFAQID